jgi:hypothetical protein
MGVVSAALLSAGQLAPAAASDAIPVTPQSPRCTGRAFVNSVGDAAAAAALMDAGSPSPASR